MTANQRLEIDAPRVAQLCFSVPLQLNRFLHQLNTESFSAQRVCRSFSLRVKFRAVHRTRNCTYYSAAGWTDFGAESLSATAVIGMTLQAISFRS